VIKNPERYPAYQHDDRLLFHDGRLCIPAQSRLAKERLLTQYHDDSAYLGIKKTYDAIRAFYFWPSLLQDTKDFVQSCRSCARNKSTTQAPAGFLHSILVPARRFEELAIDFVGPLTKSKGFNMLLVMTDRLTNYVRIEPTKNNCTAKEIAELMYYSWYRIFGLPAAITSDRDKLFTSRFWDELHKRMNIHLRMSTAYHPETAGSSERSNKTVIEALRHYTNTRQTDWAEHLVQVETSINNSKNATTGFTPNELVFGASLRLFPVPTTSSTSNVPAVTEYLHEIERSTEIAKDAHVVAKIRQTTNANTSRREEPNYKAGDQVYLDTIKLRMRFKKKGQSAKFLPRYLGPFTILQTKPQTSTYKLDLPPQYSIYPTFHARRLKPYVPNDPEKFPERQPDEPPAIFSDNDGEHYEVESIEDHQDLRGGKRRYLVHWKGYPNSDDEWVHEDEIDGKEVIEDYWKFGIRGRLRTP
jgi:hypothetical protein